MIGRPDPVARTLTIALRQIASPAALRDARPLDATLTIAGVGASLHVEVDGLPVSPQREEGGGLHVTLRVPPEGEAVCAVRTS